MYANRDEKSVIFARELRELTARHSDRLSVTHWLESVQGMPTAAHLVALITPESDHRRRHCPPHGLPRPGWADSARDPHFHVT